MRDVRKNSYAGAQQVQRSTGARKPKRRKRRRNMALYYMLTLVFVLLAGALLSMTVFFNISTIEIIGNTRYTDNEIIESSGLQIGANLFRMSEKHVQDKILADLPYVEKVTVERDLPASVQILIEPATAYAGVKSDTGYYLISEGGRVLAAELSAPPQDVVIIEGYEPQPAKEGDWLKSAQTLKQDMISNICDVIESVGLSGVASVDVTDRLNVKLQYEDRVDIELGSITDLEYKVVFARELLLNEITAYEYGTIEFHSGGASFLPSREIPPVTAQVDEPVDEEDGS